MSGDIAEHAHWEAFCEFHRANPHVYNQLVAMAREWREAGHTRCAIGMLWEVLRWRSGIAVQPGASEFRLNDHFRSLYARMVMELEPDLADLFEVRALRAGGS